MRLVAVASLATDMGADRAVYLQLYKRIGDGAYLYINEGFTWSRRVQGGRDLTPSRWRVDQLHVVAVDHHHCS